MKLIKSVIAIGVGALFVGPAMAQQVDDIIQRNAHQQERIEQGLRSGQLTVQEAAELERRAARIEGYQARALGDGRLTAEEAHRIDRAQDRFGRSIGRESHDNEIGDPHSRSAQRMADDVDRNAHQQRRIAEGARRGDLTNREVAQLQRGQSQVSRRQAHAGADGHIGRYEQHGMYHAQNYQGRRIWEERHDVQQRGNGWHAPRYAERHEHPGYNGQHRGWDNRPSSGGRGFDTAAADTRTVRADRGPAGGRGFDTAAADTRTVRADRGPAGGRGFDTAAADTRTVRADRGPAGGRAHTRERQR